MADSNITKRALASALKELMETRPFTKISVLDICEKCEMNRKSFYYHFKDKYDLVNWIYETEFIMTAKQKEFSTGWYLLEYICEYFYKNRDFYRNTFRVDGQNSFTDFFRSITAWILTNDFDDIFGQDEPLDFYVDFYADALVCSIKRWISQKDCISAEEFSCRIKNCLLGISDRIVQDYSENSL